MEQKNKIAKEYRSAAKFEVVENDNGKMVVEGLAVAFDSPTVMYEVDGIKFYEEIDRNAFSFTDMKDCALKYNHSDSALILARTRGGSLQTILKPDGLYFRAELFDTTFSKDCYELVKRGALQCSFAFIIKDGGDYYDKYTRTRKVTNIDKLFDISLVTVPAYDDTFVQARSFFSLEREKEMLENKELELRKKKLLLQIKLNQ